MNKIPFIIRDDDTCFFTTIEQLESSYKDIAQSFPITLAMTPRVHKAYGSWQIPSTHWSADDIFAIDKNNDLVEYLRKHIRSGAYGIALHGIHHTYTFRNHCLYPEFWVNIPKLEDKLIAAQQYLEDLFGVSVKEFVPPSNTLSLKNYHILTKLRFNLLNLPWSKKWRNRPLFSRKHRRAWIGRVYMLKQYGIEYPFPVVTASHRELGSQVLTPHTTLEHLKKCLVFCVERNAPFCLATHYWENLAFSSVKHWTTQLATLQRFLDYATTQPINPILASDYVPNGR